MPEGPLTKTLILEIALPDVWAEDFDGEDMRQFYGDEDGSPLTREQLLEAVDNEMGMITGGHVRVVILTGSKGGDELQRMDGWIVGASVEPRASDHEGEKDERLDYYEEQWVEQEHRRLRDAGGTRPPQEQQLAEQVKQVLDELPPEPMPGGFIAPDKYLGEPLRGSCYCGDLSWTRRHYGRVTHKHGCPARTDSYCQSHPEGCPDEVRPPQEQDAGDAQSASSGGET